jgi:hypothetical protein
MRAKKMKIKYKQIAESLSGLNPCSGDMILIRSRRDWYGVPGIREGKVSQSCVVPTAFSRQDEQYFLACKV